MLGGLADCGFCRFEDFTTFIRNPYTRKITRELLRRVMQHCKRQIEKKEKGDYTWLDPSNLNITVFMKSFTIAFKTSHVFESFHWFRVTDLISASTKLTDFMEDVLVPQIIEGRALNQVPYATMLGFARSFQNFTTAYNDWRTEDIRNIIKRSEWALIALYNARKEAPPDDSALQANFDSSIENLRSQIVRFGGPDALKRFDERRSFEPEDCHAPLYFHNPDDDEGGYDLRFPKQSFIGKINNSKIAHAMLIDPAFQMPEETYPVLMQSVTHYKKSCEKYWGDITKEIKEKNYNSVINIFKNIRSVVVSKSRDLDGVLNPETVKNVMQNGRELVWPDVYKLSIETMQVIEYTQHPHRISETIELFAPIKAAMTIITADHDQKITEFIKALDVFSRRSHIITVDDGNERLEAIQATIIEHGTDYLRGKFEQKYATIEKTKLWLRESMKQSSRTDIIINAVAQLMTATYENIIPFPETLFHDAHRIRRYKDMWSYIVRSLTIITRLEHTIPRSYAPQIDTLALELGTTQSTIKTTVDAIFLESPNLDDAIKTKIKYAKEKAFNDEDPVYQLMNARFAYILIRAIKTGQQPNIKLTPNFKHITPLIYNLASKTKNMINVNEKIYGPFYDQIILASASPMQ